jgi:hypothetical protein
MKSISASLVVLSGALILIAGGLNTGDFRDITLLLGPSVVLFGLVGWYVTVFKMD